jgi:hypothetical protein
MMQDREFYEVTSELSELVEYGGDLEIACERCPYRDHCHREELWWGCGAWEESMGDDL